jgi:hypothetical protein
MDSKGPPAATTGQKLRHELREFALLSLYLYVCFGVLILYKAALLHGEGISYEPYGLAAIKALILAKFILLGQMAHIGDRYDTRRFVHVIIHKSLLFLVLLIVLSVVEEALVGLGHGRTIATTLDEIWGHATQSLAASAIMLLILIPYVTLKELDNALGEGGLRRLLLERHSGLRSG